MCSSLFSRCLTYASIFWQVVWCTNVYCLFLSKTFFSVCMSACAHLQGLSPTFHSYSPSIQSCPVSTISMYCQMPYISLTAAVKLYIAQHLPQQISQSVDKPAAVAARGGVPAWILGSSGRIPTPAPAPRSPIAGARPMPGNSDL